MSEKRIDHYYEQYVKSGDKEEVLSDAAAELAAKDLALLQKRIEGKEKRMAKEKGKESVAGSSFVQVEEEEPKAADPPLTQKDIDAFWVEIEKLDPVSLVSDEVIDAFKYIGFNPDVVLREIMERGKKAGKSPEEIKKDLVDMVTIAIIKGSITENNLKKTSDSGKVFYKGLQDVYKVSTGGAKGKDSTHLTVARVAATVPGLVMQTLVKKPEYSKTFVGPFNSRSLPSYLRHQSSAACIPEGTPEPLKDFLLGLITAFTADQTKALSKDKKSSAEELYDVQQNFVFTTFSSKWPSEETRKKIFQQFSLSSDFDKLQVVAQKIKSVKSDFKVLTQQELDQHLA